MTSYPAVRRRSETAATSASGGCGTVALPRAERLDANKVPTLVPYLRGRHGRSGRVLLPEDRDGAVLAAAGTALVLLGRSAHRRVPDRPGAGGRTAARA